MKEVKMTILPNFKFLKKTQGTVVMVGGARSTKTYSICQYLLEKFIVEDNISIMTARKTIPSLKLSIYETLFSKLIKPLGLMGHFDFNRQDRVIRYKKNMWYLGNMDDEQKIHSTEWNYVHLEEASEMSLNDYTTVLSRLSGVNENEEIIPEELTGEKTEKRKSRNRIILSLNPYECWVRDLLEKDLDIQSRTSTVQENPFISEEYKKELQKLKDIDPYKYKILWLGEWSKLENLIYTNWEIVKDIPKEFDEIIYGLDFGFVNPSALIKIGIKDGIYYILSEYSETEKTTDDLISYLKTNRIKGIIYCDNAEPDRIEQIKRAGFWAVPAKKDVIAGIDFIKSKIVKVSQACPKTWDEKKQYTWQMRDGKKIEIPVKFNDHLMDAGRYAIYTHSNRRKSYVV